MDSFTYTIVDNHELESSQATVNLNVIGTRIYQVTATDAVSLENENIIIPDGFGLFSVDDTSVGDLSINDFAFTFDSGVTSIFSDDAGSLKFSYDSADWEPYDVLDTGEIALDDVALRFVAGEESFDVTLQVIIEGTDDAPRLVDGQIFAVAPGAQAGTPVGTLLADPVEPKQTVTFAITDSPSPFAIDAQTGEITVADSAALEAGSTLQVNVTITDSGDSPEVSSETFTVNVDVNQPPNAEPNDYALDEDTTLVANFITDVWTDSSQVDRVDNDPNVWDAINLDRVELNAGGESVRIGRLFFLASGATLRVQQDGSFTYDASGIAPMIAGESHTDSFVYYLHDSQGDISTAPRQCNSS